MSRYPWDCPVGRCKWSAWKPFSEAPEYKAALDDNMEYRECSACQMREFRRYPAVRWQAGHGDHSDTKQRNAGRLPRLGRAA